MRFATIAASLFVAASAVTAAPAKREAGDIQTVATGICYLEAGLGECAAICAVQHPLDTDYSLLS